MRYGIGCGSCHRANSEKELFNSSLPWGANSPIESTDLHRLTNLETLTIELCDWDFGLGAETPRLIREFLRNSPSIATLILRIRLKPERTIPGQLPQASSSADRGRTHLIRTITTEIANLRSSEIFENDKVSRASYLPYTPTDLPKAGCELRLTFDIRSAPPPPPNAADPSSNDNQA